MPRSRNALAPEKMRLIQVARKQLGMEDDDYRSLLMRAGGVTSSRELSQAGFVALMELFAGLGFQSTSNKRNLGRRPGFATAGQVASLRGLWGEFTDGKGTDAQLGQWLERTWGVPALRFLSAEQGPKAITALQAMVARRRQEAQPAIRRLTPEMVGEYRAMHRQRRIEQVPAAPDELLDVIQLAFALGWTNDEGRQLAADAFALMSEPEPPIQVYNLPSIGTEPEYYVSLASLPFHVQLYWHMAVLRSEVGGLHVNVARQMVADAAELRRAYLRG